jgi:hypothetical protein
MYQQNGLVGALLDPIGPPQSTNLPPPLLSINGFPLVTTGQRSAGYIPALNVYMAIYKVSDP